MFFGWEGIATLIGIVLVCGVILGYFMRILK